MLEMQPYMWLVTGSNMMENRKACAFKVTHLPYVEYDVRIAEMRRGVWKILETIDGTSKGWNGKYASAAAALQVVQSRYPRSVH